MHFQALSLLAIFTGLAYAGPWALTYRSTSKPFYAEGQWALDGPLFHAFSNARSDDPSLVRLNELVHWENYDHLYTTNQAESDSLTTRGRICGKKCNFYVGGAENIYVWTAYAPGRVPLHRFLDGKHHFYTLGEDEGRNAGFGYEGVAAWVLPGPVTGSTQFYRWRKA